MEKAKAKRITLNRGGSAEKRVLLDRIQIPDLWHVAKRVRESLGDEGDVAADAILEVWHLAHDLKEALRD